MGHETEERRDGVTVVYSRQGEKADSVIVRIARTKASGCVVISCDREIQNAVEKFGAVAISSGEFARILKTIGRPSKISASNQMLLRRRKETQTVFQNQRKGGRTN
jgi:predicted RNA-binding protein with PIN domain